MNVHGKLDKPLNERGMQVHPPDNDLGLREGFMHVLAADTDPDSASCNIHMQLLSYYWKTLKGQCQKCKFNILCGRELSRLSCKSATTLDIQGVSKGLLTRWKSMGNDLH